MVANLVRPILARSGIGRSGIRRSGIRRSGIRRSVIGRSGIRRSVIGRSGIGRSVIGRSVIGRSGVGRSGIGRPGIRMLRKCQWTVAGRHPKKTVPSLPPLAWAFEGCVSNCNADDLCEITKCCVGGGHTSSASR